MVLKVSISYNTYDSDLDCYIEKKFKQFAELSELKDVSSVEYEKFFKFMKRILMDCLNVEQANAEITIKAGEEETCYKIISSSEKFGMKASLSENGNTVFFEHNNHAIKQLLKEVCSKHGIVNK